LKRLPDEQLPRVGEERQEFYIEKDNCVKEGIAYIHTNPSQRMPREQREENNLQTPPAPTPTTRTTRIHAVIHHQTIRRNFLKIKSKFRKIIFCHRNSTINLDKVSTIHCQNFRGFGYVAVEQLSKETYIIQWWGSFEKGALY